jgi:predicted HD superfamily hydrolase involved in NAD metabolism
MELEQLRESMKMVLKETRYQHVLGVEEVSIDLAVIHGCDQRKAAIAGILHDCAKYLTDEELLSECTKYKLPVTDGERKSVYLLHAKVGAACARDKYGIEDDDILNAITYHTTGRPGMSLLEKIVFTADYIEPNRKPLPRIEEIRKAAYDHLDFAVYLILENTLEYLNNVGTFIDTRTNETYAYYKNIICELDAEGKAKEF